MVQVALSAALAPLFLQVIEPVTVWPAVTVVGSVLPVAAISACDATVAEYGNVLFPGTGSVVAVPAVTVALTAPLTGAV
jgi:hypothetical protein